MVTQKSIQGRSVDFGLRMAQTTNHTVKDQKKVFTIRFKIFDWGGAQNLVGRPI